MLNRRHIRIKVMQTIYAMHQNGSDNIDSQEKFLLSAIENVQDLYLTMVSIFSELKNVEEDFLFKTSKKHFATAEELKPNTKFTENQVFDILTNSVSLNNALVARQINVWKNNDDYIQLLMKEIKLSDIYATYMASTTSSLEEDKQFVADIFSKVIAPNDKLYEYLEDNKLTWIDDIPLVNTLILKQIKQLGEEEESFFVPRLYKDIDDKEYAKNLFKKTVLNEKEFEKEFMSKTQNWDVDRIAELDAIILKMAICEFLKFPSIPVKVTINEYLELAKEYSTGKSSIFINGILDNLVKEYTEDKKLIKTGRGLM